jgi:pimeloyl-ACP methyl ester carboxylesterase
MSAVRETVVEAGGALSPALEAGPADAAEAVVFVHGNPGSSRDWTGLLAGAGDLGRAVAIDMPGFGKARAPQGFEFTMDGYAGFIEAARARLGIERVHLVLHDFGGPFGMTWGVQHPERWQSAVLINIGVLPGYRWHSLARRWRTPVLGELMQAYIPRAAWRRAMASANPKGLPLEFVDKMYDDYDRETRNTVLKLYRATPDPGTRAQEQGTALAALHKPALVVWGAKDPYITSDFAERQREFFDVERTVLLPESGHWPFQDDPQGVCEPVLAFLRERLGAGRRAAEQSAG